MEPDLFAPRCDNLDPDGGTGDDDDPDPDEEPSPGRNKDVLSLVDMPV